VNQKYNTWASFFSGLWPSESKAPKQQKKYFLWDSTKRLWLTSRAEKTDEKQKAESKANINHFPFVQLDHLLLSLNFCFPSTRSSNCCIYALFSSLLPHTQWALAPTLMRFMCGFCNSSHATHTRLSVVG